MILHAFVSSRGFLRARTKEQKAKRRHAYDTVVAKTFVKQLEKAIKLLEVISKFEKAFEKNAKPPSDVYHMFLTLPEEYCKLEMPISEDSTDSRQTLQLHLRVRARCGVRVGSSLPWKGYG
ncbi:hypothetical protein L914_08974 [Phytophthora nicotianae]|uniref:Uncharacterized protein n=1 Tax=Phytophthora nicotianae TaxID=4792 RepID=W2J218_PHYNI|nr:hypothetical protein L916_09019 [Phytophthora nicotianae]ETM46075.1 hypothetical protein L914_08974 [Phytophthora nicotianae]